jgi:rhodanese-related sulfurtransferase
MRNKIFKSVALLIITIVLSSCTAIFENGEELATAVQNKIEQITVDALRAKIDNGEDFYLIDVRQAAEYDLSAIPGAFNIPRGVLEFKIRDDDYWADEFFYTPEDDQEIVVYCKLGFRGTLSALALQQMGFTNVKNLEGGMLSWDPELDKNAPKSTGGGGCGD